MEEKAKRIAELLKLLANESRLLILCALTERPMTVGEIAKRITNISQSALSQHLTRMKDYGILDNAKSGQNITYFIADDRVKEILGTIRQYYCD